MREHRLLQPKRSEGRRRRPGFVQVTRPDELWHLDICARLRLTAAPANSREASAATIRVPSVGLARAMSSTTRSVASSGRRWPFGGRLGRR